MLINRQLALDVRAAWISDQDHPHRGRDKKPIPSEEDFAALLDTVFQASLLHEEGKSVSTSVTWVSQTNFETLEIGRRRESKLTLEFDEPIDFEAHSLAKLSGMVNGKTSTLLACRMESGTQIWGACYFQGSTGTLGEIPAMTMEVRHFRPDYPTVTVTGIGAIQLTRGDSVIGRLEGGQFIRAQTTVLHSQMLGPFLYNLIGIEVDSAKRAFKTDSDGEIASSFFNCLDFIIEVLAQRRCGATVVFVPPSQSAHVLAEAKTAWKVHGSLEIDQLQRARLKYQRQAQDDKSISSLLPRLVVDQALRNRLRSIVDLAGIDGALLLTPSFEIIGFGMKLKSPAWIHEIDHGSVVQSVEKQLLDFSRLGTRHNSALNFVGSIGGAVAFVASTDGPIRTLVRSAEQKVCYWPDCRVSMFAT